MDNEMYRIIAENIRKYREACDLTQAEMSEKLDMDCKYYAQLEQGKRKFNVAKIVDSCDVLQVRIEDIIPPKTKNSNSEEEKERQFQLKKLNLKLENATSRQLIVLNKFVDDFISFV